MAYAVLTAFLEDNTPDEKRTPEYWAEKLSMDWYGLTPRQVSEKLLPFLVEFNRLCEFEKQFKLVQSTALLADGQSDHLVDENAALRFRVKELETALEPFGDVSGEGDDDFPDHTSVAVLFGRTTHYALDHGDFRRARSALNAAPERQGSPLSSEGTSGA